MVNLENIQVSDWELSIMKRDITDFLLRELLKVQNYSEFKYRQLLGLGLKLSYNSAMDISENDDYIMLKLNIEVGIPKWQIVELAKRRKLRMLKLPKPHPLTKQRIRELEEFDEKIREELKEMLEDVEKEKEK